MKEDIRWIWDLLKKSYQELRKNDPLRLSSSTAFFAMFSLIPTIVLLLEFVGMMFQVSQLKEEIFKILQQMFGAKAANYLAEILQNVQGMQDGFFMTIGIIIFLIFIVTTLFNVIHNSFNQILRVKLKETSLTLFLKSRGLFLVIIFCGGILFLATFIIELILNFTDSQILQFLTISPLFLSALNMVLSMALFTVWLALIFKYLPDIILPWKPVWVGSLMTTILAFVGQFIIGKIMLAGNLDNIYGSSASIILILLFIFYLSFILYYGICLIKVYAQKKNYELKSTDYAVQYEISEKG